MLVVPLQLATVYDHELQDIESDSERDAYVYTVLYGYYYDDG